MAATASHSVLEGDHIPLLKGHGHALKQKHCFPGIFSDSCDASANLLNEFDGQAVIIIIIIIIIIGAVYNGLLLLLDSYTVIHTRHLKTESSRKHARPRYDL